MTIKTNENRQRMQPLVALKALRKLIADPEKTEEVFVIIKAMSGDALERSFARFEKTEVGQRVLKEERDIVKVLSDREALRQYAPGTLARAYLDFVESEQISADGLIEASEIEDRIDDPDLRRFGDRIRDTHDLWHVVTGYGRDTFGEACLLAFTYAQSRNRGIGLITLIGSYKIATEVGTNGVYKAVWQAYKASKRAAWLPQQDWEALLAKPLEEVRQELNIAPPAKYRSVIEEYQLAVA